MAKRRTPQQVVREFYEVFGEPINDGAPSISEETISNERLDLKLSLILEEVSELVDATLGESAGNEIRAGWKRAREKSVNTRDLIETYDALLDIEVVVNGMANEVGLPMDDGLEAVQYSNLTKLAEDGSVIRSDGTDGKPLNKILKGPNFVEPKPLLEGILRDNGWEG